MTNPFEAMDARLSNIESLLIDIKHGSNALAPLPMPAHGRVMTLPDVVAYTRISKSTIYKLTSRGEMPFSKRSKRLFFEREAIDAWLLERPAHTKSDTEKDVNKFLANAGYRSRRA